MERRRVLWLMNHAVLRDFEGPLLQKQGFEVYTPKRLPIDFFCEELTVTEEYDKSLSLPNEVLMRINEIDFYNYISQDDYKILNENFSLVIFDYYPKLLQSLLRNFCGVMVLRAVRYPMKETLGDAILNDLGISVFREIEKTGTRFFYAPLFEDIEAQKYLFQKIRTLELPCGFLSMSDLNTGKMLKNFSKRVVFHCTNIDLDKGASECYELFCQDFEKYEYVIEGRQHVLIEDNPNLRCNNTIDESRSYWQTSSVLLYRAEQFSAGNWYLFHALRQGIPTVIFDAYENGLFNEREMPGIVSSWKQAVELTKKLLHGSSSFRRTYVKRQSDFLRQFDEKVCQKAWLNEFEKIQTEIDQLPSTLKDAPIKRIAVVLAEGYTGGVLDYTIRFIEAFKKELDRRASEVELVFACVDKDVFHKKNYFKRIMQLDVPVRMFNWKQVEFSWINNYCSLKGLPLPKEANLSYCIMDNESNNFDDCDYLIFTVDRVPQDFVPLQPYIVVAHDFIQRYMPHVYRGYYEHSVVALYRNSQAVFTTTSSTMEDAIQYLGLAKSKVHVSPLMFDLVQAPKDANLENILPFSFLEKPYFLWSTNASKHKNHILALQGMQEYYRLGGSINVILTGVEIDLFSEKNIEKLELAQSKERLDYIQSVSDIISQSSSLRKHLHICGELEKEDYLSALQNACFLFHPGYADNGNGSIVDAACLGVPTLSSDYPAMRDVDQYVGLNVSFFDPFDSEKIGQALLAMEKEYYQRAKMLPTREKLEKFTIASDFTTGKLFSMLQEIIRF